MRKLMSAVALSCGMLSLVATAPQAENLGKSPLSGMTEEQLIKLARSAAPAHVSKDASIMLPDKEGKLQEVVKGTNGFTCLPDTDGQEKPSPICADAAAMQWAEAYMSGAPKPANTVPGIAYMGQGGWHWEKDGKIIMHNNDAEMKDAKRVAEPPHWMMFWPFNSMESGIPSFPGKWRTYVMFDGTPYAHLMIYQNPMNMK